MSRRINKYITDVVESTESLSQLSNVVSGTPGVSGLINEQTGRCLFKVTGDDTVDTITVRLV